MCYIIFIYTNNDILNGNSYTMCKIISIVWNAFNIVSGNKDDLIGQPEREITSINKSLLSYIHVVSQSF